MKSLGIVTLHDACPSFSSRTFKFIEELEKLEIHYNIGFLPFFYQKRDLPRVLRFVDKIKSCKVEIVLHGLCHENSRHQFDNFGS